MINSNIPQETGIGDSTLFLLLFAEALLSYKKFSTISQISINDSNLLRKLAKLLLTFKVDQPIEILEKDNHEPTLSLAQKPPQYSGMSPLLINSTSRPLTLDELREIKPHLHVGYNFS